MNGLKRYITEGGVTYITTPLASTSVEQHEALQGARALLPLQLECLAPLLENLLAGYDDVVPPHQRPIKVSGCSHSIIKSRVLIGYHGRDPQPITEECMRLLRHSAWMMIRTR